MKRVYFVLAAWIAIVWNVEAALPVELANKMPDIDEFIAQNPYPEVGSPIWLEDSIKYFQYKERRLKNGEVNYDSIWANLNQPYYFALYRLAADSVMDAPFINICWTNDSKVKVSSYPRNEVDFPAMNTLEKLCEDMKSANTPGNKRVRIRPFCYFNDYYDSKRYSRDNNPSMDSYPSGHGYFRGLLGLCLPYIDPEHNEAIQTIMDEWLHCRLQKGAHWYTDIVAGRQLGEMAFAGAMECDTFRTLVFEARKELIVYRSQQDPTYLVPTEIGDYESDIETEIADMVGNTPTFTIHRTFFKDGCYNTLCLPFGLASLEGTPLAGGEVFAFQNADIDGGELQLHIVPVTAIEAGVPYLIRWASGDNIYSMTFENVTITASEGQTVGEGAVQFVGTMGPSQLTVNAQKQLFVGANNTLYWPGTNDPLKGFRAYFKVNGNSNILGAPARLVVRGNQPTGVERVNSEELKVKSQKHLHNGQVIIIRNGVKYNAQGQELK